MPYASEAQRRKFHADPKLRKLARKWDKHTPKGAKLPMHAGTADGVAKVRKKNQGY